MATFLHVKKGDRVKVIAGKDKGAEGKIIKVLREERRVIVEGVNRIKKHTKVTQSARGSQQGGIVTTEAPVHVPNVQVVCPSCGKATRIAHRRSEADDNGKTHSVRICKRCNGDI